MCLFLQVYENTIGFLKGLQLKTIIIYNKFEFILILVDTVFQQLKTIIIYKKTYN